MQISDSINLSGISDFDDLMFSPELNEARGLVATASILNNMRPDPSAPLRFEEYEAEQKRINRIKPLRHIGRHQRRIEALIEKQKSHPWPFSALRHGIIWRRSDQSYYKRKDAYERAQAALEQNYPIEINLQKAISAVEQIADNIGKDIREKLRQQDSSSSNWSYTFIRGTWWKRTLSDRLWQTTGLEAFKDRGAENPAYVEMLSYADDHENYRSEKRIAKDHGALTFLFHFDSDVWPKQRAIMAHVLGEDYMPAAMASLRAAYTDASTVFFHVPMPRAQRLYEMHTALYGQDAANDWVRNLLTVEAHKRASFGLYSSE